MENKQTKTPKQKKQKEGTMKSKIIEVWITAKN